MRCGLTELTSAAGYRSDKSRATSSAPSNPASIATARAPYARACAILAAATLPPGNSTTAAMPARAAYAAADAAVLPVDAHSTVRAPASTALATATTMPRSLKDAVGFMPSNLMYNSSTPTHAASRGTLNSGVSPSLSESAGVSGVTGRNAAQRASTPAAGADSMDVMRVAVPPARLPPDHHRPLTPSDVPRPPGR